MPKQRRHLESNDVCLSLILVGVTRAEVVKIIQNDSSCQKEGEVVGSSGAATATHVLWGYA